MKRIKNKLKNMKNKSFAAQSPIVCKHCGKKINRTTLVGLSLICPLCKKPQNGQPHAKSNVLGGLAQNVNVAIFLI